MDSLSHLAFAFARFVAREHPRFRLPHRTSGLAAIRRWNFRHRHQHILNRNGGLRCRGAPYHAPLRRYGPGGGLLRRHTHPQCLHSCHHSVHRSNPPGAPGPSTRTDAPREEALVMPKEAAVAPNNVDEQVVAVPNVAPGVGIEHEDEASASNITMDAAQVLPSPPVYAPMEWILVGPSAGWLVDDPDRSFTDEELATPPLPPLMYSCPAYGNGSSLPSPTPSDEDPEHFNPPGCDPLPEFTWTPAAVPLDALKPRLVINLLPKVKTEEIEAAAPTVVVPMLPDLNHPTPYVEKEHLEVAPPSALPTPSSKDRVLLCRLASVMVVRPVRIRVGTWSPVALGLTSGIADLRLHEVALPSSSAEEPLHR
ncbi:hypothetical protein D1007_29285 [Hordeum vulgare]|nr:hypothetical protein D1007_29285 [Hordeum vulgare]